MSRSTFISQAVRLRRDGNSIRAIAQALDVPKGRVERALKSTRARAEMLLASSPPLVGRERESELLLSTTRGAVSGQGRIVLLAGEPGIGKTRLAHETVYNAVAAGALAVEGRCYNREGAPPYWPWIQIVRALVEAVGAERLWRDRGPAMAVIAELDASLALDSPTRKGPPPVDPQARFRLLDAMAELIRYTSRRQSLVVLLDDLHWADRSSLLLLEFVARGVAGSAVLILGAYQDVAIPPDGPLEECLGNLSRENGVQHVRLTGLDASRVAQLIESLVAAPPDPDFVDTVVARTGGNPFFVAQLAQLEGGDKQKLPFAVREAVRARAGLLSRDARQMLATAATVGNEFHTELIVRAVPDLSDEEILRVLDECTRAGIIEENPLGSGAYAFTHGLMRETLVEDVPPSERSNIHRRLGEALEVLHRDNPATHAAEIAYHFDQASDEIGIEKSVHYYGLAAEAALAGYAAGEALGFFERILKFSGLETQAESIRPGDEATAELLFGLARAQALSLPADQMRRPLQIADTLIDYHLANGEPHRAAAIAEYPLFVVDPTTYLDHTARVRAVIDALPESSPEAARLWVKVGTTVGFAEDYEGARKAFDTALEIAGTLDDRDLEALALSSSVQHTAYVWRIDMERCRRCLDLAVRRGDLTTQSAMCFFGSLFSTHAGRFVEARDLLDHGMGVVERTDDATWRNLLLGSKQIHHIYLGEWEAGREAGDRQLGADSWTVLGALQQAVLECLVGETERVDALIGETRERLSGLPFAPFEYSLLACILASIDYINDRHDWVEEIEMRSQAVMANVAEDSTFSYFARSAQAISAARLGDVDRASALQDTLAGPLKVYPHRWMCTYAVVSVDRILGLLATAAGDRHAAAVHFEAGWREAVSRDQSPEAAWCAYELASILAAGVERPGLSAPDLVAGGQDIVREFGMLPLQRRFESLSTSITPSQASTNGSPTGLTRRETEVLRLIATGNTDRQIAETLFISPKTVGKHVSSILRKTDTTNRTQAAAFATRHDLR